MVEPGEERARRARPLVGGDPDGGAVLEALGDSGGAASLAEEPGRLGEARRRLRLAAHDLGEARRDETALAAPVGLAVELLGRGGVAAEVGDVAEERGARPRLRRQALEAALGVPEVTLGEVDLAAPAERALPVARVQVLARQDLAVAVERGVVLPAEGEAVGLVELLARRLAAAEEDKGEGSRDQSRSYHLPSRFRRF